MYEILAKIPPDQLLLFIAAVCFLIAAFWTWVSKKVISIIEQNTKIKFTAAQHQQVDIVAKWAIDSTQQVFRHAVLDAKKTADELNKEKLTHALMVARGNLTPEVSAVVKDEQLVQVIEAKISQSKAPPPMMPLSNYPPSFLVPSTFPPNLMPGTFTDPSQRTSMPPTTFADVESIKK